MLSPESWNFKPPKHSFSVFRNPKESTPDLSAEISNHYFNFGVTVVLPDTVLVPEDLNTTLTNDSTYYKVSEFPVYKFLDKQFIESFIQSGELTALSVGTCIDTDDCAAITPSGHLILNLLKETYQSLGLEGVQSHFSTERYVVQICLKDPSFTPGKKNYERVIKCLSEFVPLQMDFILAWTPPVLKQSEGLVCPSSVAAYLAQHGAHVNECTPKFTTTRRYNVKLPSLDTDLPELLEWLGAVAHGVDINREDAEGEYLSSYRGPLDTQGETQIAVLTYQGLFTSKQMDDFFSVFSSYVKKRKDAGWAAVHVQGFADSPVSWGLLEHTFHSDGANDYTVVLQADGTFHMVKYTTAPAKIKYKLR